MANFRTGVLITGDSKGAVNAIALTKNELNSLNRSQSAAGQTAQRFTRDVQSSEKSLLSLSTVAKAATVTLGALGVGRLAGAFIESAKESERLKASLKTVTGSADEASKQFARLLDFAGQTPFTLQQSIEGFIKLKSLGLDPSERALMSFGNTSAALGKQLSQMIEAVADASTFQFERLLEFGIKAKQEADKVTFTFQGVETEVQKNAAAITEYLTKIGETKFGTAMADQMERLPGLFSNLEDAVTGLFLTIGDAGGIGLLESATRGAIDAVNEASGVFLSLADNSEVVKDAVVVLATVLAARFVPTMIASANATRLAIAENARYQLTLATMAGVSRTAAAGMLALDVATTGVKTAMAALGGPVGVALIAAAAVLTFADNADKAREKAVGLADALDDLVEKFEEGTKAQREFVSIQLQERLTTVRDSIRDTKDELKQLQDVLQARVNNARFNQGPQERATTDDLRRRIAKLKAELDELNLSETKIAGVLMAVNDALAGSTKKVEEKTKATIKLTDAQEKLLKQIKSTVAPEKAFQKSVEDIVDLYKLGKITEQEYTHALSELGDEYGRLNPLVGAAAKQFEEKKRLLESLRTPLEIYKDGMAELNRLFPENERNTEGYRRAVQALEDDLRKAADNSVGPWQDFGQELQQTFRDTFIAAGGDLDNFLKRIEASLKEAALRLTFDATIGRIFTGGAGGGLLSVAGGAAGAASAGGGGFGGAGLLGVAGLGGGLQAGVQGLANTIYSLGFQNTGSALFRAATTGGLSRTLTNPGISILGGLAGGFGGNLLGEALFGKQAESSFGSIAGGLAGAFGGPLGVTIGSAIGSLLDVAFGGDGKKRFNFGVIQGSRVGTDDSSRLGNVVTASSGLRLQTINRRGGAEGQQAADTFLQTLLTIDDALTSLARGAGVGVDFSKTTLAGIRGDAGKSGVGDFFGLKGFNGVEGTLEEQADAFVKAWLDEVNDELPKRVADILRGVNGTAQELVSAFQAALDIDALLDLDVVARTEEALKKLTGVQATLYDQYSELTEAARKSSASLDGSVDALLSLNSALAEQKSVAAQLASAYRGVGIELDALLGNTIQGIRESVLSDEELYNLRRSQIADLSAQLESAISPEEIDSIVRKIDSLSADAFGRLDDSQKAGLAEGFISFLTEVADTAQERIDAGLGSVAAQERSLAQAIEVDIGANTFQAAVGTFEQIINNLSNGTININVGGAQVPINIAQLLQGGTVEINI